jgi:hypothetical protein
MANLVEVVVELAMEMEQTDPIDFGYLRVSEENAYRMIASKVIEENSAIQGSSARELMLLATVTHLVVENFVLQQKLMQGKV